MKAHATQPIDQERSYDAYVGEGANLLSRICDGAHLALVNGRLLIVADLSPALADALANWGADFSELEPEDAL